jgi:hypothetical protein
MLPNNKLIALAEYIFQGLSSLKILWVYYLYCCILLLINT